MTAEPPLLAGASQVTVADALPAVAATLRGAPGTVRGVTGDDAADAAPSPATFDARTENV